MQEEDQHGVSKTVAGQGSDPPPFTGADILLLFCMQVRCYALQAELQLLNPRPATSRQPDCIIFSDRGTTMLWSIQYNR
jgi:hypothetical protein